jgi:hypothetical protein
LNQSYGKSESYSVDRPEKPSIHDVVNSNRRDRPMGTWALPQTPAQASELVALLAKPLPARQAPNALSLLLGDDDLFDSIIEEQPVFGDDTDVRDLVKSALARFLQARDLAVTPWHEQAYQQLTALD